MVRLGSGIVIARPRIAEPISCQTVACWAGNPFTLHESTRHARPQRAWATYLILMNWEDWCEDRGRARSRQITRMQRAALQMQFPQGSGLSQAADTRKRILSMRNRTIGRRLVPGFGTLLTNVSSSPLNTFPVNHAFKDS